VGAHTSTKITTGTAGRCLGARGVPALRLAAKGVTMSDPPRGLQSRGLAFWTTADATYELTDSERELLLEVCRLMDECESLRQAVEQDGTTVAGSNGQPRVHPAVGELRQHRLALGRLLSQLALPDEDEGSLATPLQARGRAAASRRWAGHVKRGA
jgi:hypothetical protein